MKITSCDIVIFSYDHLYAEGIKPFMKVVFEIALDSHYIITSKMLKIELNAILVVLADFE